MKVSQAHIRVYVTKPTQIHTFQVEYGSIPVNRRQDLFKVCLNNEYRHSTIMTKLSSVKNIFHYAIDVCIFESIS